MSLKVALMTFVPLVLFVASGCATPEHVVVRPVCEPAPIPALPEISKGELWDALGDARYRELERYHNGLWSVIDEQAAVIEAVCN